MIELELQLKRLGKKKILKEKVILNEEVSSLKDLITVFVTNSIKDFNEKIDTNKALVFLTPEEIQEQSQTGKIGFGQLENKTKPDEVKSIENAIQCFKDGVFLVFMDDEEIKTLDEKIQLNNTTTIVFLRMTFLAGTHW